MDNETLDNTVLKVLIIFTYTFAFTSIQFYAKAVGVNNNVQFSITSSIDKYFY